jgi:hypothetical protein
LERDMSSAPPLRTPDTHQSTDVHTANARLSSLLAAHPHVIVDANRRFTVSVVVPNFGEVAASRKTLPAAMALLTGRISRLVMKVPSMKEWPVEWVQLLDEACVPSTTELAKPNTREVANSPTSGSVVRTKDKMPSIGVTGKSSLHERLAELAAHRECSLAQVARKLFADGLARLNKRLDSERLDKVLSDFEGAYEALTPSDSYRWMLRVERRLFNSSSLLARELGKSQSQIATLCLSAELAKHMSPVSS